MTEVVEAMKRVGAILRACADDPMLRKKVANETMKYVKDYNPTTERNFDAFLSKLERKFKIKQPEPFIESKATGRLPRKKR